MIYKTTTSIGLRAFFGSKPDEPRSLDQRVYFVRCSGTGHIKIGFAGTDLYRRVHTLQTGNPMKLELLASVPGSKDDEAAIHR